jgi:hypothetical protein
MCSIKEYGPTIPNQIELTPKQCATDKDPRKYDPGVGAIFSLPSSSKSNGCAQIKDITLVAFTSHVTVMDNNSNNYVPWTMPS